MFTNLFLNFAIVLGPSLHCGVVIVKLSYVISNDGVSDWPCPPSQVGEWWREDSPAWPGPLLVDDVKTLICSVVGFMHSFSKQIMNRHRDWDGLSVKWFIIFGKLKDHNGHRGSSPRRKLLEIIMDCWAQVGAFLLHNILKDYFSVNTPCLHSLSSSPLLNARFLSRVGRISRIL